MKFYDCKTAPSPRRVRVFAAEKGIDLDVVQVDLASGEQFSDEFRAKNPDCVVPVLELDDGTCLTEVIAICQYLEELHPEPTLFGETPAERAVTMMWNAKAELQGLWAMADAFRNTVKGLQGHALPHHRTLGLALQFALELRHGFFEHCHLIGRLRNALLS